jgi:hypothetical protein
MCVRNVDVNVSCSSQVDEQLDEFFIDTRAKEKLEILDMDMVLYNYS